MHTLTCTLSHVCTHDNTLSPHPSTHTHSQGLRPDKIICANVTAAASALPSLDFVLPLNQPTPFPASPKPLIPVSPHCPCCGPSPLLSSQHLPSATYTNPVSQANKGQTAYYAVGLGKARALMCARPAPRTQLRSWSPGLCSGMQTSPPGARPVSTLQTSGRRLSTPCRFMKQVCLKDDDVSG